MLFFAALIEGRLSARYDELSKIAPVVYTAVDYIFVIDRDSAVNTEGAKLAEGVMDNELVKKMAE